MSSDETEAVVRMLISSARLTPSGDELRALVDLYPSHKEGIERLYRITETRYADPAVVFVAAPTFADWNE
jgi:hypothetical protein